MKFLEFSQGILNMKFISVSSLKGVLSVLSLSVVCFGMTACTGLYVGFPYEEPVKQGNWVTQGQIDQLEKGMTPVQVQYLFGAPILGDMFSPKEWIYVYTFKGGMSKPVKRHLLVHFNQYAKVDRWDADAHLDYLPIDIKGASKSASK